MSLSDLKQVTIFPPFNCGRIPPTPTETNQSLTISSTVTVNSETSTTSTETETTGDYTMEETATSTTTVKSDGGLKWCQFIFPALSRVGHAVSLEGDEGMIEQAIGDTSRLTLHAGEEK